LKWAGRFNGKSLPLHGGECRFDPDAVHQFLGKPGHRWLTTRGKSGLHRATSQLTTGQGNLTESATESKPPMARKGSGKGERVE